MQRVRFLVCTILSLSWGIATSALAAEAGSQDVGGQCHSCHGADGAGKDDVTPRLAGQYKDYLLKQLEDMQADKRPGHPSGVDDLTPLQLEQIATYYANQPIKREKGRKTGGRAGAELYQSGNPKTGAKQCINCHGEDARGKSPAISMFPALAGQRKQYLTAKLKAYRDGTVLNDVSGLMTHAASNLTDDDITALATYLSELIYDMPVEDARKSLPKADIAAVVTKETPVKKEAEIKADSVSDNESEAQDRAERAAAKDKEAKEKAERAAAREKAERAAAKEKEAKERALAEKEAKLRQEQLARADAGKTASEAASPSKKVASGRRKAITCEVCHGRGGVSSNKMYPSLAGASPGHIVKQLKDFKDGARRGAVMQEVAKSLSIVDMEDLAEYFAHSGK